LHPYTSYAKKEIVLKKQIVSITLDPTDLKEVKRIARRKERSVSYMINLFIKQGLQRPSVMERVIRRDPTARRYAGQ